MRQLCNELRLDRCRSSTLIDRKIEDLKDELQRSIEGLNSEFDENHQTLIGQIKQLNDITDEIESMHKATTVGSLVGSTVGVVGGIAALVGFLLAPFTAGVSLAITAVGIAGGVTGAACNITNIVQQKTLRETIEKTISDFQNTISPIIEHLNTICNTIEELQQMEQMYSATIKITLTSVRSVKMGVGLAKLVTVCHSIKIGEVAAKASKTLQGVGKLLTKISSVFLILDLYSIVNDSIEISEINQPEEERKAEAIKSETLKFIYEMRKRAAKFQETVDEIEKARDTFNRELQIC